ncbi:MAG: NRDE family protein [Flavobacteriales bacterium]
MCLIVLAYKVHPRYPLIVAANRDEFLERPTLPAAFWPDAPHILAGRDLKAGGTWLGFTKAGRFAALTNYRDLRRPPVNGPSRGALVRQVLEGDPTTIEGDHFDGFNLLYGAIGKLRYYNNIEGSGGPLAPGVHGISNHLLDTPWPKVVKARDRFAEVIKSDVPSVGDLFGLLNDPRRAPDEALPDTGLDLDRERALSSVFISTKGYGTRCSTVLMVDSKGRVLFEERTHQPRGDVRFDFDLDRTS